MILYSSSCCTDNLIVHFIPRCRQIVKTCIDTGHQWFWGGRKRRHGNPYPLVCVGKHWQACTLQFISCTVHLHSVARSFFFFIHCLMSSFICLLAVLSHFKVGQSISPRLDIHSTRMKHEGIKKHRRLNTSTTELNCCGKNLNQLVNKMLCWN